MCAGLRETELQNLAFFADFVTQRAQRNSIHSKKLSYYLNNHRQHNAKKNHRSNWKIKFEVFFLNSDITRQSAHPT
jgi:ferritin